MKKLMLTLFVSSVLSSSLAQDQVDYKKIAVDQLESSIQVLESMVENLSEEDLKYVPKDGGWSIMNCLEHLAFTEPRLGERLRKLVEENKVDKTRDLSAYDWMVIAKVTDRTKHVMTPEPFRPQPELKDKGKEYFLAQLKEDRKNTIEFIKKSEADLRHIFGPYPYGEVDMIQLGLVAASHMYRHTLQIKENIVELYPDREEFAKL